MEPSTQIINTLLDITYGQWLLRIPINDIEYIVSF